jgi:chromosome segregation ATPase
VSDHWTGCGCGLCQAEIDARKSAEKAAAEVASLRAEVSRERAAREEAERELRGAQGFRQKVQTDLLAEWARAESAERRADEAEAALREATPHACGGYGDFAPDGGWEAWEERHAAALARVLSGVGAEGGGTTP